MGNTQHKDENQKRDDSVAPQVPQEETVPDYELMKQKIKKNILILIYAVITFIIVCLCITVIALSVVAALSTKLYAVTNSGRSVGLVTLDISAAIALTVSLFSVIALWRKKHRQILLSAVALGVLLIAQAVIIAASLQVSNHDADVFSKALVDSFHLAQQDNIRAVKLWHNTQNGLQCCGVLSPEDYKDRKLPNFFPIEIPISCCPSYNSSRTTFMQEREREMCKLKKTYYKSGCRDKILNIVISTENALNILVAILILFELIETVWNVVYLILKKRKSEEDPNNPDDDDTVTQSKKFTDVSLKNKA